MSELQEHLPKNPKLPKRKDPFPKIHRWIGEIGVILFGLYELLKFVKYLYHAW
jgi:hypothetical protein